MKEKDQLTRSKTEISDRHGSASSTATDLESRWNHITTETAYMNKHIREMTESRTMMETLTTKIRGEIQAAE